MVAIAQKSRKNCNVAPKAKSVRTPASPNRIFGGKYKLESRICTDLFGTLYRVTELDTGKRLGLKILARGFPLVLEPIFDIDHPNLWRVRERIVDRKTESKAIVLDPPKGGSIKNFLVLTWKMPVGQAVSVALQILSALHALHTNELVHGCLGSDGVFISRDQRGNWEIRISNLWIGADQRFQRLPYYLSPEQLLGEGNFDRRADIWSLGVMLYEMVLGCLPFPGDNRDAICAGILLREPRFHDDMEELSPSLVAIIKKAMAKEPKDRYPNAAAMAKDLLSVYKSYDVPMGKKVSDVLQGLFRPAAAAAPSVKARTGQARKPPGKKASQANPGRKTDPASSVKNRQRTEAKREKVRPLRPAKPSPGKTSERAWPAEARLAEVMERSAERAQRSTPPKTTCPPPRPAKREPAKAGRIFVGFGISAVDDQYQEAKNTAGSVQTHPFPSTGQVEISSEEREVIGLNPSTNSDSTTEPNDDSRMSPLSSEMKTPTENVSSSEPGRSSHGTDLGTDPDTEIIGELCIEPIASGIRPSSESLFVYEAGDLRIICEEDFDRNKVVD